MYENVALAIRINEQGDSLTGSMVDDIFYILQKCARRASETGSFHALFSIGGKLCQLFGSAGSIQAVCASLNHINNILSSEASKRLHFFLNLCCPSDGVYFRVASRFTAQSEKTYNVPAQTSSTTSSRSKAQNL
jgi:hypothetical protein